jgi:hypothetical protein
MPPPRTVRQPSLHCGISLSPRAAQGQTRSCGDLGSMSGLPPESGLKSDIVTCPRSAFAAKSIPLDQVPATLNLWLSLHAVRIALGLIASVVGLVAVAR